MSWDSSLTASVVVETTFEISPKTNLAGKKTIRNSQLGGFPSASSVGGDDTHGGARRICVACLFLSPKQTRDIPCTITRGRSFVVGGSPPLLPLTSSSSAAGTRSESRRDSCVREIQLVSAATGFPNTYKRRKWGKYDTVRTGDQNAWLASRRVVIWIIFASKT